MGMVIGVVVVSVGVIMLSSVRSVRMMVRGRWRCNYLRLEMLFWLDAGLLSLR